MELLSANDGTAKSQEEERKARRVTALPLMCWRKENEQNREKDSGKANGDTRAALCDSGVRWHENKLFIRRIRDRCGKKWGSVRQ